MRAELRGALDVQLSDRQEPDALPPAHAAQMRQMLIAISSTTLIPMTSTANATGS